MQFIRRPLASLFVLFCLIAALPAAKAEPSYITFPSDIDWVTRETPHFTAMYRRGQDNLAIRALKAAERAFRLLTPVFPPGPEKTWLVISDFQDSTNGYALDFPYPHIVIYAAPPEATGQLAPLDDWLDSVLLHEYVHILHIYPANGLWKVMRSVFGSWVIPNGLMPSHFHEGMAVLLETEKSDGGRGRGTEFKMYRRMAVDAKVWGTTSFFSRDQMDGSTSRWPHGTSAYFFGYTLSKELWDRKGAKGIYDLTLNYSDNWPYFLNGPVQDVYGVDYATLWADIFKKTTIETEKEIAHIKEEPLSHQKLLTTDKFLKWDVAVAPDATQVAFRRYNPTDGGAIEIFDRKTSKRRVLLESVGSAEGLCWVKANGKDRLIISEPDSSFGYSINHLKWIEVSDGGKNTFETSGANLGHIHQLGCDASAQRLIVYQEVGGKGVVRELSVNWTTRTPQLKVLREWSLPTGTWVTSLLIESGNEWIALRDGLHTNLYRWGQTGAPEKTGSADGHLFNLKKGSTPGEIYGIANFDGRNEIYKVSAKLQEAGKRVALLGGANAFDVAGSTIIFSSYSHGGYDIAEAEKENFKTVKTERRPAAEVTLEGENTSPEVSAAKDYSAWRTLKPTAWIPSILFVPNGVQFGIWIPGFDISQRHTYNITGGYDTRGLPFADFNYQYRFAKSASLAADAYYLPSYIISSQTFFKRWGVSFGIGDQFFASLPFLQLSAIYRRVEAVLTATAKVSVGLQLSASQKWNMKRRPLSISNISGTSASVSHSQFFKAMGSSDNYFSTVAMLDQYVEAPWWREHVFYAAARLGYTWGTVAYNNYFDAGGEVLFSQQRGTFLNRGFQPQTFLARRVFNLNLEYRFPIAVIERGINYMPFKLKAIHFAVVSDYTSVDSLNFNKSENNLFKQFYASAGGELRSEWTFGSYLPSQLRVGVYHGFGRYGENVYVVFGAESLF